MFTTYIIEEASKQEKWLTISETKLVGSTESSRKT
jgi:hypothetical protein